MFTAPPFLLLKARFSGMKWKGRTFFSHWISWAAIWMHETPLHVSLPVSALGKPFCQVRSGHPAVLPQDGFGHAYSAVLKLVTLESLLRGQVEKGTDAWETIPRVCVPVVWVSAAEGSCYPPGPGNPVSIMPFLSEWDKLCYRSSTSFYPRFAPLRVRVPAEKVKRPCPTEEDAPPYLGSYFRGIIFCNRRHSAGSYYSKLFGLTLGRIRLFY